MKNLYTLEKFNLPKELFGEYIASGKDHDVYVYAKDSNKVIKIVKNSYLNLPYMFKCLNMDKFNEVPCVLKKELLGYLTINNEYYPVWIQDRVATLSTTNQKEAYKQLSIKMIEQGFFPRSFTSDKIQVLDIHPKNLAESEEILILDCYAQEH